VAKADPPDAVGRLPGHVRLQYCVRAFAFKNDFPMFLKLNQKTEHAFPLFFSTTFSFRIIVHLYPSFLLL